MSSEPLPTNPQNFGKYEILEKLGRGGSGVVFKARHPQNGQIVALKIATQMFAPDSSLGQRFVNEFTIASQLNHPHLVRALEYGVENHLPYLVMEYVPGLSLDKRIKLQGPLSESEAVCIFTAIAQALAFIHRHNIIHRDVKPGNILLHENGIAKLTDLGLIKDLESSANLTKTKVGMGTYEYSAPEQLDDARNVDGRTDIYSLAATMYTALTRKFPFGTGGQVQLLKRKLGYQFVPLNQLLPEISPTIEHAITVALHPDPDRRPASCEEFLANLQGTGSRPTPFSPPRPPALPARERRTTVRYSINLEALCRSIANGSSATADSRMLDISAEGACLQVSRHFSFDTLVQIKLLGPDELEPSSFIARVRWVKEVSESQWVLGCQFTRSLGLDELEKIYLAGSPKTVIL